MGDRNQEAYAKQVEVAGQIVLKMMEKMVPSESSEENARGIGKVYQIVFKAVTMKEEF